MHALLEQAQDGTQAQFDPNKGHVQEECSGVGVCDRKSGSCRCPTVSTCSLVVYTLQAKLLQSAVRARCEATALHLSTRIREHRFSYAASAR
jgi:hypothetical protein